MSELASAVRLLEALPHAALLCEAESLRIVAVNAPGLAAAGRTAGEIAGLTLPDLRRVPGPLLGLEPAPVALDGTPYLLLVDRATPELHQAWDALRLCEERYRAFVEQSTEGIWCVELGEPVPVMAPVDTQIDAFFTHGRLITCNAAMARMYGFETPEQLVGTPLAEMLVPADPANREYLRAFVSSGYRLSDATSHEVDRHGRRKHFLNNLVGVVQDGYMLRAWGTQRDVTAQHDVEERVRQGQKMEAVGRLAGAVTHDFNNLLTVIVGYCELALRTEPDPETRRRIQEIRRAGDSAAALTGQLLAFARNQVVELRAHDASDLVAETAELLRRLVGEDVQIDVDLAGDAGSIRVDRSQIEQVLVNLAVNARDAMPSGGRLRIAVAADTMPGLEPPVAAVLVEVSDTGRGMDAATRERIFEPFFTTKDRGRGTGLGLATVQQIVRQSGGQVAVASAPGSGSTFRIHLPRVAASSGPPAAAASGPRAVGSGTILLVEDDAAVRALTRETLIEGGYAVIEARSAEEGLQKLQDHDGPVRAVVTDVVLPEMGGVGLASHASLERPGLRVLYISGYTEDAVLRHGVAAGSVPFLQKPFTPTQLLEKLAEALAP